jgi:hypothetical protein
VALYRIGKFLHISFAWNFLTKEQELEQLVFPTAKDWMRYSPNCWIVYTYVDANDWYARIKPHVAERDHFLICELNIQNRQGWMDKWVWEWFNKPRDGGHLDPGPSFHRSPAP